MDSKRSGRKVVDPDRFDPDRPSPLTSQQWLLTRIQTSAVPKRAMTPRRATATAALMLTAAIALAGSIAATVYALPLISEFSDGCQKLSDKDVARVFGAGTTVDGSDYDPPSSTAATPGTAKTVLAQGDICAKYVSGWKDGDHVRSSTLIARTQTSGDASAVFRREREAALTGDPQDTASLRTFLNDTRLGNEAFCTVTTGSFSAHGVMARFDDKVVYVSVPTANTLTDEGNCDRARRLANELR